MIEEISRNEFFQKAFQVIKQEIESSLPMVRLSSNDRGNVMEIPVAGVRGCHYEIGFHRDCHEIALHFQGTPNNNLYRSEGFRNHLQSLEKGLGYPLILGPHERVGRRRLWIKLPNAPLTPSLLDLYSDLTVRLILTTFPILKSILDEEKR